MPERRRGGGKGNKKGKTEPVTRLGKKGAKARTGKGMGGQQIKAKLVGEEKHSAAGMEKSTPKADAGDLGGSPKTSIGHRFIQEEISREAKVRSTREQDVHHAAFLE